MSKQNIKLSKQNHTGTFQSQSCSAFRFMFFIGETLLLLDIKAKEPSLLAQHGGHVVSKFSTVKTRFLFHQFIPRVNLYMYG